MTKCRKCNLTFNNLLEHILHWKKLHLEDTKLNKNT